MASTTFSAGTVVTAAWLNDVNAAVYKTCPTVASAAAVTLPTDGTVFTISGTTTITSVVATGWTGKRVTLIFSGALTFTDGSNLKLAGNFVTTADDTISLVCDGTNWYETGRSVN